VSLENQIADETRHKEELESVFAGWEKCWRATHSF
jgi:hypothetical protein